MSYSFVDGLLSIAAVQEGTMLGDVQFTLVVLS